MARLAIDLVSGPAGVAAILRQGLLDKPYNTPSLPLDIGYSDSIPWYIRRAVLLRDRTCAWPKCDRPAVYCDVHHLRRKEDGGETSVENCALVCQFHHDVCIHRRGWQLILHPDGTTEARAVPPYLTQPIDCHNIATNKLLHKRGGSRGVSRSHRADRRDRSPAGQGVGGADHGRGTECLVRQ
jgi:hypothetical protein